MVGMIGAVIYYSDPPVVQAAKEKSHAEDELQKCMERCVSLGAESFAWNGLYGAAWACSCGGTLP